MINQFINDPYGGQRLSLNGNEFNGNSVANQLTTINSIFNETKRIKQLVVQYYQIQNQLHHSV